MRPLHYAKRLLDVILLSVARNEQLGVNRLVSAPLPPQLGPEEKALFAEMTLDLRARLLAEQSRRKRCSDGAGEGAAVFSTRRVPERDIGIGVGYISKASIGISGLTADPLAYAVSAAYADPLA